MVSTFIDRWNHYSLFLSLQGDFFFLAFKSMSVMRQQNLWKYTLNFKSELIRKMSKFLSWGVAGWIQMLILFCFYFMETNEQVPKINFSSLYNKFLKLVCFLEILLDFYSCSHWSNLKNGINNMHFPYFFVFFSFSF